MLVWPADVIQTELKPEEYILCKMFEKRTLFPKNVLYNYSALPKWSQLFQIRTRFPCPVIKTLFFSLSLLSAHQLSFQVVTFGIFGR